MEKVQQYVNWLDGFVWGPFMLVLILGTGIWLTASLGFIQVRYLPRALGLISKSRKQRPGAEGEISSFQALTTALSATVGTGNIAGVATAIAAGGPGAIFWMWVSAFFGMATKYAEAVLAVHYRQRLEDGSTIGGPMYYIAVGLKQKWLGWLFALFAVIASFGIGSMVQSNSVALAMKEAFDIPMAATGIILTVLTALVIIGGIRRIGKVTEKLVPFMAVFYIIIAVIILAVKITAVPAAIALIFKAAFTPTAAVGGFAGAMIRDALRFGVARGVFSNEAGLGSAPIAHAAARTNSAVRQGLIAMTGVFFDTIIICSLTALVIITTGMWTFITPDGTGLTSTALTSAAFVEVYGAMGAWLLAVALSVFAYSTILGWSYYGEQCAKFMFGVKFARAYKVIFCGSVLLGTLYKTSFVWLLSDLFNGMMAVPNLIGLLGLSIFLAKHTKAHLEAETVDV